MAIKGIVFDYGQVISLPQDHGVIEKLAAMAGVKTDVFEPLLWKLRGEYDRGAITATVYYKNLLSRLGVTRDDETIAQMVEMDLFSWKNLNPATVALMEDVKKAGYKLGILSNMPFDFLAYARKNFPLFSLPDAGIFSCEVSSIKPEEPIYRRLFEAIGCESGELVFFDDNADNIAKARELGIHALLWRDAETARGELARLSVAI
jgi:putative hydrolase of the HAD superfamily